MKKIILLLFIKTSFLFAQAPAIQWQKTYGGTLSDRISSVKQTPDGGYITVGSSSSIDGDVTSVNHGGGDVWVVKTSATGTIEWQKCYGGTRQDTGICVDIASDGGYFIGGYTYSNDGDVSGNHSINYTDILVLKISSTGTLEWSKTYGGTQNEYILSIKSISSGGCVFVGETYSNNDGDVNGAHYTLGTNDGWAVRISSTGTIGWKRCYGGTSSDYIHEIISTNDGGYILAACTASNDGDVSGLNGSFDYWVVKINVSGTLQWQKNLGGSSYDSANGGVKQTADGGYLIGGNTDSVNGDVTGTHGSTDFWLVKLTSSGNLSWQKALGGTGADLGYTSLQTADGGYVIAGYTYSTDGNVSGNHGSTDSWFVKLGTDLSINNFAEKTTFTLFPNPAKENLTLQVNNFIPSQEITITDILGKTIYRQRPIGLTTTISISNLKQGVYFLILTDGTQKITQKFIKE